MLPRLIALDMDGTLLDSRGDVLASTRRALAEARRAGSIIAMASGRQTPGLAKRLARAGLDPAEFLLIGSNGAVVADGADDGTSLSSGIAFRRALDWDSARLVLEESRACPLSRMIPDGDELLAEEGDETDPFVEADLLANGSTLRLVRDLADPANLPGGPVKVQLCGEREALEPLAARLAQLVGDRVELTFAAETYLDVNARGVTKGTALREVAAALGIPLAQTAAFGDNGNDVDMLRTAGLGVAMGNGVAEAKAAADIVTTSHDDDGIARVLDALARGDRLV